MYCSSAIETYQDVVTLRNQSSTRVAELGPMALMASMSFGSQRCTGCHDVELSLDKRSMKRVVLIKMLYTRFVQDNEPSLKAFLRFSLCTWADVCGSILRMQKNIVMVPLLTSIVDAWLWVRVRREVASTFKDLNAIPLSGFCKHFAVLSSARNKFVPFWSLHIPELSFWDKNVGGGNIQFLLLSKCIYKMVIIQLIANCGCGLRKSGLRCISNFPDTSHLPRFCNECLLNGRETGRHWCGKMHGLGSWRWTKMCEFDSKG